MKVSKGLKFEPITAVRAQMSVSDKHCRELREVSEQMWNKFKVHHTPIKEDC